MSKPIVQKVCPIVSRCSNATPEILMFRHPLAGIQLVKGTVEPSENPTDAARRELFEESGIDTKQPLFFIGKNTRMVCGQIWYFYHLDLLCTRNQWSHFAPDNGGIELQFFWHALLAPPPLDCGALYARVLNYARPLLLKQLQL
jgi:8-oxo-dGTP pyrophosphatase MutT (NUDIX family)